MYYVYLIRSLEDKNYYIGQTNNVMKRFKEYNSGKVRATRYRTPFKLLGYEMYKMRNEVRYKEYTLKKHGDKKRNLLKRSKIISLRTVGPSTAP